MDEALRAEDNRCRAYVNTSTRRKLLTACRQMMLADQGVDLIRNESTGMLSMLRASYRAHVASEEGATADHSEFGSATDPKRVRYQFTDFVSLPRVAGFHFSTACC